MLTDCLFYLTVNTAVTNRLKIKNLMLFYLIYMTWRSLLTEHHIEGVCIQRLPGSFTLYEARNELGIV